MTVSDERRVPYRLEVVDYDGVAAIHAATVEVLSETGVSFEDREALELLSSAGAEISDEGLVKIPETLLERAVDSAPSVVRIYSREGEEAMRLERDYVYCGTGSDCPSHFSDYLLLKPRNFNCIEFKFSKSSVKLLQNRH